MTTDPAGTALRTTRAGGVDDFEFNFPAIKGFQAGREYYVTMCPLRIIPRLFVFNDEELPAELRAQRTLNRGRVPEMARYIVENPDSYVFSALTASVNAPVQFAPLREGTLAEERVGFLTVPMSATFVINDGQHRRAAIQQAMAENPSIGNETIAIVMFIDVDLSRSQQMFADLNRYAIRPGPSIGVLYDHRDPMSDVTRQVVAATPLLRDLTEMEHNSLSQRSRKLFTLSAIHTATTHLLDGVYEDSMTQRIDLASAFWSTVADQFPLWGLAYRGEITGGELRRDFIHTHSITLHSLGRIGNTLLREGHEPGVWTDRLAKLRDIDWHRTSEVWEGRATTAGNVTKSRRNVELTTAYIRSVLGMPLPPDENRAEQSFTKGEVK